MKIRAQVCGGWLLLHLSLTLPGAAAGRAPPARHRELHWPPGPRQPGAGAGLYAVGGKKHGQEHWLGAQGLETAHLPKGFELLPGHLQAGWSFVRGLLLLEGCSDDGSDKLGSAAPENGQTPGLPQRRPPRGLSCNLAIQGGATAQQDGLKNTWPSHLLEQEQHMRPAACPAIHYHGSNLAAVL